MFVLTVIMHLNRTHHKGCHESVITLEGSGAEKGMKEEKSGIHGLPREIKLVWHDTTGFLN